MGETFGAELVLSLDSALRAVLAERDRWKEEYQSLCPIATDWENRAVRAETGLRERLGPAGAKMLSDLRERAEKAESGLRNMKDELVKTTMQLSALRAENERLREAVDIIIKTSEEVLTAESNHNEEQAKRAGLPPGYRLLGGRWEINAAMHSLCNAVEHCREALNTKEEKA